MSSDLYKTPRRRRRFDEDPTAGVGPLRSRVSGPAGFGLIAGALLVFGLGGWAATASLAGGAVADGEIAPDGDRRVVQHLEGGVVKRILVGEGDLVERGAQLIELENPRAQAKIASLAEKWTALLAEKERLLAELSDVAMENALEDETGQRIADLRRRHGDPGGAQGVERLPQEPPLLDVERVKAIYARQRAVLESRTAHHHARATLLRARVESLKEARHGVTSRREGLKERLALFDEELSAKQALSDKGVAAPLEILSLRRHRAELTSAAQRADAEFATLSFDIKSAETEIVTLRTGLVSENAARLAEIETTLAEISEQLAAERDVMRRTIVVAPVAGRVLNLAYKTVGGVVAPGAKILELVPENDRLIISARLSPNDVDIVSPGMPARVRLAAFPSRTTPELEGSVISVSPDRVVDEWTGRPHYRLTVSVDVEPLSEAKPSLEILPGMSAEVLVVAERRTLLDYLMEPVLSVLRRGMRES